MKRKFFRSLVFSIILALSFAGCGGGGGGSATLSSIALSPANPAALVGATQQFVAIGTYSDSTTAIITSAVTWSSSVPEKVMVDSAGLATAVAVGSSVITATLGGVAGSTNPSMDVGEETTIDVHAHANSGTATPETAQDLTDLLVANGISKAIIMQPPTPIYTANPDVTTANDRIFFSGQGSAYAYMYGGSELQPMLFAAGQTDVITAQSVYPSNTPGSEPITVDQLADLNAIRTNPDAYTEIFRVRAHEAADSLYYVGFGEIAPYHMSLRSGHPQMIYSADCPGLLLLAELAAEHDMFLDIHMEETAEKLEEFSNLLSQRPNTKIIWDHAGWTNTGGATAAVFTAMLDAYPNLYLNLKMRNCDTTAMEEGCPTNDDNSLKTEWETLLTTYAGRIMVGTDAKFWSSGDTMEDELTSGYTRLNAMLELLPDETQLKIRYTTAMRLFGLAP